RVSQPSLDLQRRKMSVAMGGCCAEPSRKEVGRRFVLMPSPRDRTGRYQLDGEEERHETLLPTVIRRWHGARTFHGGAKRARAAVAGSITTNETGRPA